MMLEGQWLPQKDKKRRKRIGEKQNLKPIKPNYVGHFLVQKLSKSPNFDFCACPSKNVAKRGVSGKKDMLVGANLAHIQAENLQNVQKMRFWQKALWVNGLNRYGISGVWVNTN